MEKEYDNSTGGTSFIIILDWEGNHIESFIIRRSSIISVDPTNSYLLAFSRDDPSGSAFYKYQKKVLLVTLSLFLAFNLGLCIKSFAQTVEVGICDATEEDYCKDDEGVFLQIGQWVYGDE